MSLRSTRTPAAAALAVGAALLFSACSTGAPAAESDAPKASGTVTITDNHGEVEVPVNPKTVVALDNHVFSTLDAWDIELAAAPKGIMGTVWPKYLDESVADVGSHREPNLETIIAADPDLIIAGYRFGDSYDEIKKQNPNAAVIDIAPREGEDLMSELKRESDILGQIFDKKNEAKELNDKLDSAIADAKGAYNGTDTVMAVNTSGGKIGYLAPGVGRSVGPVFGALDLKPALEVEGATSDHQGDDISVEAIAASNPQWIIALDRDAAFAPEDREEGSLPAAELIAESEALKNVPAVKDGNLIYLDANFYLTEDIQAYTDLFENIKDAFAAA
ncbi:ABC transporter substrate-binding protein [Leucobacter chromiireducens]|uniref:Iron ABC transporter substrate-binding protein n=1 Tax=Leucobacter chromiireducens subsp. chromiireducens TaxID=660067 RepID=A0ABS1SNQ6_9MICO|nr:iron ABC transporter substrate-binding protein [Leucobacter chromiireducens subsp. chromiireducens]